MFILQLPNSIAQISTVEAFSFWVAKAAAEELWGEHLDIRDRGKWAQPSLFLRQNKLLLQQKFREWKEEKNQGIATHPTQLYFLGDYWNKYIACNTLKNTSRGICHVQLIWFPLRWAEVSLRNRLQPSFSNFALVQHPLRLLHVCQSKRRASS